MKWEIFAKRLTSTMHMWCLVFTTCSAKAQDLVLPSLLAKTCSLTLWSIDQPISPMYEDPHNMWWQKDISKSIGFTWSLTDFKEPLMVLRGLKVEGTLCFLRILTIFSAIPWMKRRWALECRSNVSVLTLRSLPSLMKALINLSSLGYF